VLPRLRYVMMWMIILIGITIINISACHSRQPQTPAENKDTTTSTMVQKTDNEWKAILSPEEFRVLRQSGTERPFTGTYDKFFEKGKYYCKACHNYLFSSDYKYNSGCGWPAFYDVNKEGVVYIKDNSMGMQRIEVRCKQCSSHLGHVFDDGPLDKTGIRFCINSVCLTFEPEK